MLSPSTFHPYFISPPILAAGVAAALPVPLCAASARLEMARIHRTCCSMCMLIAASTIGPSLLCPGAPPSPSLFLDNASEMRESGGYDLQFLSSPSQCTPPPPQLESELDPGRPGGRQAARRAGQGTLSD